MLGDTDAGRQPLSGGENPLAGARLAFVGAGVMAESIISGLLKKGLIPPSHIIASHPRPEQRRHFADRYGIATAESNREAAERGDLVLLTIKPQVLHSVMRQLHANLRPEQVVVSVIAGAPVDVLAAGLGHEAVVRVMPNTPAQV